MCQQNKAFVLKGFKVKPGEKLCDFCYKILFKTQSNDDSDNQHFEHNNNPEFTELQKEEDIDSSDTSLTEVGCSPLKLHVLNKNCKKIYAKEKFEKMQENVKNKIELVFHAEVPIDATKLKKVIEEKPADMGLIVDNIEQLHLTTKKKQIQLLPSFN